MMKGNCDAELTLDMINLGVRKKYDGVLVFSGDGDFAKVYEYISTKLNKKVIVMAPMGKNTNKRTSLSIKDLSKNKIITLEAVDTMFQHYAIK